MVDVDETETNWGYEDCQMNVDGRVATLSHRRQCTMLESLCVVCCFEKSVGERTWCCCFWKKVRYRTGGSDD